MLPSGASVSVSVTLLPKAGLAFDVASRLLATATLDTVSVMALEVEPLKVPSPPYTAVIVSVPTGRAPVLSVATPVALIVPVPIAVVPL